MVELRFCMNGLQEKYDIVASALQTLISNNNLQVSAYFIIVQDIIDCSRQQKHKFVVFVIYRVERTLTNGVSKHQASLVTR